MTARNRTHWGLYERPYPIIENKHINFVAKPDENTAACNCRLISCTNVCFILCSRI
jgi:hypothetical protein